MPIDAILTEIRETLERRASAVIVAPPGAGKTTRVAPALLDASWMRRGGKLILLSPRRIAARAAAARMAAERGERVGDTIGYRVRLDTRVSARTRIEVVTEGVFTRQILSDPELKGVAGVIFDEFHERSLEGDLGLALARDVQMALRLDLRIIVMSATLDASGVAALLDDAPVIVSEGRMFSVTLKHRPRDPRAPLEREVASAVRAAMRDDRGSALVFLPGVREIDRTAEALRAEISDPAIQVRPLYAALSPAEQDSAIEPALVGKRKIVLATSIAETSLTIEGVRIVIDSGLTRRPRFEPALGLTRLETVRASQASIEQRRGRAGRLEPGVCWRLWSEGETRALQPFDRPEMLDSDLSGLALDLARWGVRDPVTLAWLDPPPKPAWDEAIALLKRLCALDGEGRLTPHGEKLACLPLPPRLAHMLARAGEDGDALLAAKIAVLVTEQGLGGRGPDLRDRLHRFDTDSGRRADAARGLAARLVRQAGCGDGADGRRAGAVLALAFPERVAKARGGQGQQRPFLMANGRAAVLDETEALSREPYLVIADTAGAADRARILLAAPITEREIEDLFAETIEATQSVEIDANGAVRGRRLRRLGKLILSEGPLERVSEDALSRTLLAAVLEAGIELLDWNDASKQARARVALMRRVEGERWPDWSDAQLGETLGDWLAPALIGRSRLKDVDVAQALLATLPYDLRRRLDLEAPERFTTPAQATHAIDYTAESGPALDVRLQELFGLDKHPCVVGGRIALTLRLLSPAQRPVQTTNDLPGFWRGSYASVRTEMRGRYPKHPWPEDPLTAPPTRRAKPKGT